VRRNSKRNDRAHTSYFGHPRYPKREGLVEFIGSVRDPSVVVVVVVVVVDGEE
jgi:hypothetical protein